ncbi:kinase-like domain-containing protein [Choanephora cucurbitarum]|nr:kinase-like domain-containing protein [Choanephora cucurbitarum]
MIAQDTYWSQLSTSMVDKIIGDEFQLLESLGHGAYGCLFLGQSTQDNSYVAVKILPKSGLDLQQLQLQQLEIDIQSSLQHPNLLALHRVIQDNEFIYMVMELCDQGDLFDFVIRDQDINPIREEHVVKKLFSQILDGVESMHATGVYHRDIKLENVLLKCEDEEDEDELTCKVADFGLATRERYSMEFGCGSTSYLAPEHFFDEDKQELVPYDAAASDTWSLGILLLALMFGRNPWQEASTADSAYVEFKRNPTMLKQQLFPELSSGAYQLLVSVLASDGADRPSIVEMKDQFLALDHLYETQQKESPLTIPTVTSKHTDANSFDSAFFSGGNGSSWSDMVEEDEELARKSDYDPCTSPEASHYDDDEETEMFVHNGEEESWWL